LNSGVAIGYALCKACGAHGPIAVGAQKDRVSGRGALLESLHTDPLQPCYATGFESSLKTVKLVRYC